MNAIFKLQPLFILLLLLGSCSQSSSKKETEQVDGNPLEVIADGSTNPSKFDELLANFNQSGNEDRSNILYRLNELSDPRIRPILEKSLDDDDEYVRIIAIQSIRKNQQVESIDKLIALFKSTESKTMVSNLVRAFADFQLEDPIPAIIEKLSSDNKMIVYDCLWVLGEIGGEAEIKVLQKLTSDSKRPVTYDGEGLVSQTTDRSLGEKAAQSIARIKARQ